MRDRYFSFYVVVTMCLIPPPSPPPQSTPPPAMPQQQQQQNAAPAPAQDEKITAGQINTISNYSGAMGIEAETFVDAIDRAKGVFQWSDAETAKGAQQKLSGTASNWLKHMRRLGKTGHAQGGGEIGLAAQDAGGNE